MRWPLRAFFLAALLVIAACTADTTEEGDAEGSESAAQPTPLVVDGEDDEPLLVEFEEREDPVPALLATLTVEEKVGQLIMPMLFGLEGTGVDTTAANFNRAVHGSAEPVDVVTEHHLGGVIYLAENIESAEQVRAMSRQLQDAAQTDTGIGLLIAIDQEGGRVSRLSDEVTLFPSAADLAGDPELVRQSSYITGQQVRHQGINVVLAPVADIVDPARPSFIGDRSFGTDPEVVAELVGAAVEGLQDSGVAAAVKHWPGHGATPVDSHRSLPELDIDRDLWDQRERRPFEEAIEREVAIVLVGHLALPQLDQSGQPATVSASLVEDLLRDELGFEGVVMTDALNMGAVGGIPQRQLVVQAINAGADIVLIPVSVEEAAEALLNAVEDGTISQERLDQSVTRVLRLKDSLGLLPPAGG